MRYRVLLLLAAALVLSADDQPKERPKVPEEFRPLVDLARAAPPEFGADAILRLVASGKLRQKELSLDLLEEAFQMAGQAQHPVRMVRVQGVPPDTDASYAGGAGQMGFDALSLECRAVTLMLSLDARRGREMFAAIRKPALDPVRCDQGMVPDVSPVYGLLARIVSSAYSAQEKRSEENVRFLIQYLDTLTSPVDLAPMAQAVISAGLTAPQLEVALAAFASKLDLIAGDDRSFTTTVGEVRDAIEALASEAKAQGIGTEALRSALRKYLVVNLTGPRCEDTTGPSSDQVVDWFNREFRGEVSAIGPDETRTAARDGTFQAHAYFQSLISKRLNEDVRNLRFNSQGEAWSAADRSSPEWRQKLDEVLGRLNGWTAADEPSAADYFHEKAILLRAVYEMAPAGAQRDSILESFIALLNGSIVEQQDRVEWFWHAWEMRRSAASVATAEVAKVLRAYRASGNVVLALYGLEEQMFP